MSVYFCRGGRSIVCNVLQIYIKFAVYPYIGLKILNFQ